jgi:outer membrane protein assembly factor BamA
VEIKVPKLPQRLFADVKAVYRNFTKVDFYGVGQNSRRDDRTTYQREDTNLIGRFGVKPTQYLTAGVQGGWLATDQPNYLQTGAFVDIDYRDEPANPRSGGHYVAQWMSLQDRKFGLYDHGRYDLEVQQYFPFFNQRRVIALRGKTTLTRTAPGQQIPFFMQPTIGGAEDLRGFREFRFQDNNSIVLNAEYRWEAFSGLDLALFADAGQVASRPTDIDFSDLQKSYGVGARFNTSKGVFMRIDLGFSGEGRQVFFKFGHVF